ncbi:bifunctional diaminohydroxyphosphoribosylaminopyrimidine deaminase/5-amino-6-(5-phosphoribosylamino)uracil reductase RibD [Planctomicrobium piriforme]|uniref:Riboflavin biosynthesis protein RibD n=1 Tax=Planctomicrobium piriforme TaxID=1576369 RepID=A0A1I3MV22_9PLAN|nr:bifunctional diaminohydroxyphosphoribosylaminopyrimidine deaminase/5-amino-6-(5-phosphoribosylamino)uracil reductase RibD [Planctomicrobium piriforme]SFJ00791.1 diaminohydroxyphosphoribosylaminopyrimidine deaminase / 5-amino-6-(5-phosphoribosylamino)uracil reductase [Planctomicrobium piriforme]
MDFSTSAAVVFPDAQAVMRRALELARRGLGRVEPNPCVGAVLVDDRLTLLGEGYHELYGGPHAEVMALRQAGSAAAGSTLFVTLEPCAHHGKTPPCADAVIAAGIRRVVIATHDPAPHTGGSGIAKLKAAGINVEVGLCGDEAARLIAPFTTLFTQGRPYVHAKWAMTLDGKLATRTGSSKWISNARSREIVHQLRGRMDAILVGIGTALADDPLLTPRPAGLRSALRIVLDPNARLPLDSQLVWTAGECPVLVVVSDVAEDERLDALRNQGVEVLVSATSADGAGFEIAPILQALGQRRLTNLLVEGGSRVLGAFQDEGLIDEVHCFIAPKLVGGQNAISPIGGRGAAEMPELTSLIEPAIQVLDGDVYVRGMIRR